MPVEPAWTRYATEQTEADIQRLVRQFPNYNVGIVTGQIVGLDFDVLDKAAVKELASLAGEKFGPTLWRGGNLPKLLGVCRTVAPFPKITSRWFVSTDGKRHRIECLCAGQQFVAFGIHPNTGMPYRWAGPSLLDIAAADLTPVTERQVQEFIPEAERVLLRRGFRPIEGSSTTTTTIIGARSAATGISSTGRGLAGRPSVSPYEINNLGQARPLGPDFTTPYPPTKYSAYAATARLHQLFDKYDGRVRPAIRELVEEIGAAGCGRHDSIVAIVGRLVHQRWGDQEALDFLVPLVNEHFTEGDWSDEVVNALAHARRRDVARLQAMRGASWPM